MTGDTGAGIIALVWDDVEVRDFGQTAIAIGPAAGQDVPGSFTGT
ncbi:MAG TPA: hypothetical protein VLW50_27090 [Streptosporangiaceae bacterium]|nr:hypothetical protein [Streptosporangiaceae bacterium]